MKGVKLYNGFLNDISTRMGGELYSLVMKNGVLSACFLLYSRV
jgi:hypothetical protein